MNKPISLVTIAIALALSACSAKLVQPVKSDSQYAPINEKNGTSIGVVYYLQDGAGFVVKSRREDAYKQMWEQCGGDYEIIKEWVSPEIMSSGFSNASLSGNQYMVSGSANSMWSMRTDEL